MKIIKRLRSLPGDSLGVIRRTPPLVFAMAVLSLGGFIGASTVLVRGFRTVENTITVTGASTESFESDIAKWSVQVKTSGKTQIDSFSKHKESINKTMEFLKANGIEDSVKHDVYLGPVRVSVNIKPGIPRLMKSLELNGLLIRILRLKVEMFITSRRLIVR